MNLTYSRRCSENFNQIGRYRYLARWMDTYSVNQNIFYTFIPASLPQFKKFQSLFPLNLTHCILTAVLVLRKNINSKKSNPTDLDNGIHVTWRTYSFNIVNATDTQPFSMASNCRLIQRKNTCIHMLLPIVYQVTLRPHNRLSDYSKWLDTFQTYHITFYTQAW